MSVRYFLDTNIFVYANDLTAPAKRECAASIIADALEENCGSVSFQVIQEFFSVAFRKFASPLSIPQAERYLSEVFRPMLRVHSSERLYSDALTIRVRYRINWYDSIIVASAVQARCDVLFTEDLQHGLQIGDLTIRNPFV